jgi:hypothetical protein
MAQLGRPPTAKEFVIQSILGWREPAPTLVDIPVEMEEEVLPAPRTTEVSIVFDLAAPRTGSHPSFADGELQRDTLPSPPPSIPDVW